MPAGKPGFEPNVAFTGLRGENLIDLVAKKMGVAVLTRRPISGRTYEDVVLVDVVPYVHNQYLSGLSEK